MTARIANRRLLIEAAAVTALAAAAWGFLYGPFLETCCGNADVVTIGVLWSASLVGGFLTGSGNNPGRGAVLLGLIIEALTVWAIFRAATMAIRRGERRNADNARQLAQRRVR
jgi:hypothetical protein